jgi:hypothetical protein
MVRPTQYGQPNAELFVPPSVQEYIPRTPEDNMVSVPRWKAFTREAEIALAGYWAARDVDVIS